MKAPWAKRGNGCSNFERKSGFEKWIGIAGACASNCKVSGVGEHSTSIETCSASYHSYGSHITSTAANGTSSPAATLCAAAGAAAPGAAAAPVNGGPVFAVALSTAVCDLPLSFAARNGLTCLCVIA